MCFKISTATTPLHPPPSIQSTLRGDGNDTGPQFEDEEAMAISAWLFGLQRGLRGGTRSESRVTQAIKSRFVRDAVQLRMMQVGNQRCECVRDDPLFLSNRTPLIFSFV